MYINPGDLDKKVTIVKETIESYNSNGYPVMGEENVRICYARVTDTSGTELIKANSEFSQAKRRFLVRYTEAEINTSMIVRYGGRDYDIVYVNPYGDSKEYLEIWTEVRERNER